LRLTIASAPDWLAPIRVDDRLILAIDGEQRPLLSIRYGQSARLCKRVKGAAEAAAPDARFPPIRAPATESN